MPPLPLTTGHQGRPRLNLPLVRAVNVYTEPTSGGPEEAIRTARPGLTQAYDIGAGPILRTFQQPGIFSSLPFNVSGGELYFGSTLLGSVAYSYAPRFAAAQQYLALVCGGALYIVDNSTTPPTFTVQTTFDDGYSPLPPFSGVAVLYNIWIYPVAGSTQFFFSRTGDPSVINAANFGAAQTSPTPIVEVATLAEELYFFKTAYGVEIWDFTGNLTAPFAESLGRTFPRGCAAQNSVAQLDNGLFWVGDDYAVYRTATVPQRVSSSLIEDELTEEAALGDISQITAYALNGVEGHVSYILNLPMKNVSYAYDCQTKLWFQWGSQEKPFAEPGVWLPQTCSGQGNEIYMGSSTDGRVWLSDPTNRTDDGLAVRTVVTGALWMKEDRGRCNNVTLHMVRGVATLTTPAPICQMRYSDDGGRTFTSWLNGQLGPIGSYKYKVSWHSLGLLRQPGRLFEFAITDPVLVAIEGAAYNAGRR